MRVRRELVPAEVAAWLAIVVVYTVKDPAWPIAVPLFVAASLARYLRGGSWAELARGGSWHAAIGAAAGLAALVLALAIGTPAVEAIADRAVEWSTFPIVRGSGAQLAVVMVLVAVTAIATELVIRGWIVERVAELQTGESRAMPVIVGAIAELAIAPGDLAARLGAALFGVGLSWLYLAGKRSVTAPIAARLAFQLGAVTLEGLRLIG